MFQNANLFWQRHICFNILLTLQLSRPENPVWSNHFPSSSASRELYMIFKEIRSISQHIQAKEEEDTINADWKFAAMVNTLFLFGKFAAMVNTLF